jgi:hypothetical protein
VIVNPDLYEKYRVVINREKHRKYTVRSGFEIALMVEIGNQSGLRRLPSQLFPGSLARGRAVKCCEMREPLKMAGRFLGSLAHDRHVQAATDYASNVSEWHAFVGDCVIPGPCGLFLNHKPVEMSGIEPVHRGPAVEPLTHTGRNALLSRETDEARNEAMITVAMDRWRKTHQRHAHTTHRQGNRCFFRGDAGKGVGAANGHNFLGREAAGRKPTTCAPCAARDRAVSTPSPAETPVTRIRLPCRFTPDKTSSVVEVAPNTSTIVLLLVLAGSNSVATEPRLTNGQEFDKTESVSE